MFVVTMEGNLRGEEVVVVVLGWVSSGLTFCLE